MGSQIARSASTATPTRSPGATAGAKELGAHGHEHDPTAHGCAGMTAWLPSPEPLMSPGSTSWHTQIGA